MTLPDAADVWQWTVFDLELAALPMTPHFEESTVYVLHFDPPYGHARHYIGIAHDGNVLRRLAQHRAGRGSPLVRAAYEADCFVSVVLTLPGDLGLERRFHNRHGTRVCPLCRARRDVIEIDHALA